MDKDQYIEELENALKSVFDDRNFRTFHLDMDGNHTYSAYINFRHNDDSPIARAYRKYCESYPVPDEGKVGV